MDRLLDNKLATWSTISGLLTRQGLNWVTLTNSEVGAVTDRSKFTVYKKNTTYVSLQGKGIGKINISLEEINISGGFRNYMELKRPSDLLVTTELETCRFLRQ